MSISLENYYKSISKELFSKYNRVRDLVEHHGEDGRYKETILRKVISNFLPHEYGIGTGFVATRGVARESEHNISTQIDLLIYKKSYPILFQEEDFVIVIPDAVRGLIEVKSNLKNQLDAIDNSNELGKIIIDRVSFLNNQANQEIFNGIFSFEGFENIRQPINKIFGTVNHIVLNSKYFIKNYSSNYTSNDIRYYDLQDLAVAYFIQNLISHITAMDNNEQTQEQALWYPNDKELNRIFNN